jgi:hypothetical protein
MKDLGLFHRFLGVSVQYQVDGLFLTQRQFALDIPERASMVDCKPVSMSVDTQSKLSVESGPHVADPTHFRSLTGVRVGAAGQTHEPPHRSSCQRCFSCVYATRHLFGSGMITSRLRSGRQNLWTPARQYSWVSMSVSDDGLLSGLCSVWLGS